MKTKQELERTFIIPSEYEYETATLYKNDFRVLHNLCCDVLEEHPQMVGIKRIQEKLKLVINSWEENC